MNNENNLRTINASLSAENKRLTHANQQLAMMVCCLVKRLGNRVIVSVFEARSLDSTLETTINPVNGDLTLELKDTTPSNGTIVIP